MNQFYELNMVPNLMPVVVRCSQYDTSLRQITFTLLNGSEDYEIPADSTVTVRGTKPDSTAFEYEASYTGNTVTFYLKEQMTVLSGKIICEVRITNLGDIIGSANFTLLVEPAPINEDTPISETDLPMIEEAIQKSEEAIQKADELIADMGEGVEDYLDNHASDVQSIIEDYLDEHPELTNKVTDVQVNGTSVVANNVAEIPVATWSSFGVTEVGYSTEGPTGNNQPHGKVTYKADNTNYDVYFPAVGRGENGGNATWGTVNPVFLPDATGTTKGAVKLTSWYGATTDGYEEYYAREGYDSTLGGYARTVATTSGDFTLTVGNRLMLNVPVADTFNGEYPHYLNVDGTGYKELRYSTNQPLSTGEYEAILQGEVEIVYDGTYYLIVNGYSIKTMHDQLSNVVSVGSVYTTIAAGSTSTSVTVVTTSTPVAIDVKAYRTSNKAWVETDATVTFDSCPATIAKGSSLVATITLSETYTNAVYIVIYGSIRAVQ